MSNEPEISKLEGFEECEQNLKSIECQYYPVSEPFPAVLNHFLHTIILQN